MAACILHEKLVGHGGAQQVAFELARVLDAPVYAGWVDEEVVPDDVEAVQLFSEASRRLLALPGPLSDFYNMLAWQHVEQVYDYDVLVLNQTTCTWLVPKDDQAVVLYGHHPPRAPYDMWPHSEKTLLNAIVATAKRALYEHTLNYPDVVLANSALTASRFERYLDITPDNIVNPPVDTRSFSPDAAETGDYYLSLGRLAPNKRVPDIVRAASKADVELVVAGSGPMEENVREAAPGNVDVLGRVTEEEKRILLSGAKAFVMNAEREDFGLTPVEAMASGTPVIGVNDGYTTEHVRHGKNGLLYKRGRLEAALRRFENNGVSMDDGQIRECASEHGIERFSDEILDSIELARKEREWSA